MPELLIDLIECAYKVVVRNRRLCPEKTASTGVLTDTDLLLNLSFATKARELFLSHDERFP